MTRRHNLYKIATSRRRFILKVGISDFALTYFVIKEINRQILRRDVISNNHSESIAKAIQVPYRPLQIFQEA